MIVIYASDHGYGHATRQQALAQHFAMLGHEVVMVAGAAAKMLSQSFAEQRSKDIVQVFHQSMDVGLVQSNVDLSVDVEQSRLRLNEWIENKFNQIVAIEVERLKYLKATLIVADAPPTACVAAHQAGIPSVIVSNFTWLDQYGDRFGTDVSQRFQDAYGEVAVGFRLSPGKMPLAGINRVVDIEGVLARQPTRSRNEVRSELGISKTDRVIMLGLGKAFSSDVGAAFAKSLSLMKGWKVLVSSDAWTEGCVPFPAQAMNAQDYVACADLLIAKAGYSTCAEAALAGVPQIVFPIPHSVESERVAQEIELFGYGFQSTQQEIFLEIENPDCIARWLSLRPAQAKSACIEIEQRLRALDLL